MNPVVAVIAPGMMGAAVGKRLVETGRGVRVHKTVTETVVRIDEPLMQQDLEIEHVPVNAWVEGKAPVQRHEGDTLVVPVLEDGRVVSMVILSLSIEIPPGAAEQVYAREPKLRDVFLQVLFDHANAGGFRGSFTDGANMVILRRALHEAARTVLGESALDVLITEIVRQDS